MAAAIVITDAPSMWIRRHGCRKFLPILKNEGEKNDAFAQFFAGQSYLKMLTAERVGIAADVNLTVQEVKALNAASEVMEISEVSGAQRPA